ncbi:MAG: hypothetical protein ACJ8J0_14605 [Longimicrobiaceae bacterium]
MKPHDTGSQRPTLRREPNGVWRMVERAAAPGTQRQPAAPGDPPDRAHSADAARGKSPRA